MLGTVRKKAGGLLSAAVIVSLMFFAGCGGGGGGLGVGDRGGDGVAPVLNMVSPVPSSSISDLTFRAESFAMRISSTDTSAMDMASLVVTLKMDSGSAQNITSYFSADGASAIATSNLYQFNRTLFEQATNVTLRTMTITYSMKDIYGNQGSGSAAFTVYPSTVPPPPE